MATSNNEWPPLPTRWLGASGIAVSEIGFGCMGLSEFYGPIAGDEREAMLQRALDRGVTLFDTADMYGRGENEELVGRALRTQRPRVVIATKCGIVRTEAGKTTNGTARHIVTAVEASLRRLGTDYVDLLYLHRLDPAVPVEESVAAMARCVAQGKVRAIGLSKVTLPALLQAEAVHPIAAIQMRYSLRERAVEHELVGHCLSQRVALVAYSPLGKGTLTESVASMRHLSEGDHRRRDPRCYGQGLVQTTRLLEELRDYASQCGCTVVQLTLRWLLSRAPHVIPIPGMRCAAHVDENVAAGRVVIPPMVMDALERWSRAAAVPVVSHA